MMPKPRYLVACMGLTAVWWLWSARSTQVDSGPDDWWGIEAAHMGGDALEAARQSRR